MIVLAAAVIALAVWKFDLINTMYFKDQLTQLGLIINRKGIVVMVIVGDQSGIMIPELTGFKQRSSHQKYPQ